MEDGLALTEHLARLARIELDPEEGPEVAREVEVLLGYLARLRAVDVEGEAEWTPPLPPEAPLRADVAEPSLARDVALGLAPEASDGFFKVPRVLDDA